MDPEFCGEEFLIIKDPRGYPQLVGHLQREQFFKGNQEPLNLSLEEGKKLYQEMTGKPYPFGQATSRQVLWDLIEAALQYLP